MRHLAMSIAFSLAAFSQALAQDSVRADIRSWPNHSGEFGAMLTLISEDNLQEFAKPSDRPVNLRELDTARHGDHIAVKLTFTGMEVTRDRSADVTYDFRVVPPGGSGTLEDRGLSVLKGKVPDRHVIFDNRRAPLIAFDPDYPLGTYTVTVVVTDNIGHRSLTMSKQIELTK
jgi:hypothetical protein